MVRPTPKAPPKLPAASPLNAPRAAEFSRPIAVARLEPGELTERIVARADELKALAARFGLVALESLSAEVTLRRIGRGRTIEVEGRLMAEVVQSCVVTLEPLKSRIEETFLLAYAPAREVRPLRERVAADGAAKPGGKLGARKPVPEDADDEIEDELGFGSEPPEPLAGGIVDIGEAVAQQFALALDPYPRKPQARLEDVLGPREGVTIGPGERGAGRPFEALGRLARRKP